MAKKDIYKEYGIDYKDGKILTPFGMWVNPLLPIGSNSKVGNAATWSIYHGNETLNISDFGSKTQAVMKSANVREIVASVHVIAGDVIAILVDIALIAINPRTC